MKTHRSLCNWEDLPSLRSQLFSPFEQVFDDFFNDFYRNAPNQIRAVSGYPKMDVAKEGNKLIIRAAVPGVASKDLKVEVSEGGEVSNLQTFVKISGHMADYYKSSDQDLAVKELCKRKFARTVSLPYEGLEDPTASLDNGILTLEWRLPEEKKAGDAKVIPIVTQEEKYCKKGESLNQEDESLNQEDEALNQEDEDLNQEDEALNQEDEDLIFRRKNCQRRNRGKGKGRYTC